MIQYQKIGVDDDSIRLLKKLGADFPLRSLLLDIENNHLTINKVFYDNKLYGILVLRGERTRRGQLVLVVCHAIAEDGIEEHFSSILAGSLQEYARLHGFDLIRQHADKKSLARMLEKYYGQPSEWVYTIGVLQCLQTKVRLPALNPHLARQQTLA